MRFSAANALRLSMLANAAYLDENGAKTVANTLGLPNFVWLDLSDQIDNLYGFVAGCRDYAVLSFRGTAKFEDWMTNVNAAPTRFSWFFEGAAEVAWGVYVASGRARSISCVCVVCARRMRDRG